VRKRVHTLLLNLNYVKVETRKSKTYESLTFIDPCDRHLPIDTVERICTSYPHSTNVVTPLLPRP
jgi:hypothetical protein